VVLGLTLERYALQVDVRAQNNANRVYTAAVRVRLIITGGAGIEKT
jgi:hypothetical protein